MSGPLQRTLHEASALAARVVFHGPCPTPPAPLPADYGGSGVHASFDYFPVSDVHVLLRNVVVLNNTVGDGEVVGCPCPCLVWSVSLCSLCHHGPLRAIVSTTLHQPSCCPRLSPDPPPSPFRAPPPPPNVCSPLAQTRMMEVACLHASTRRTTLHCPTRPCICLM